MILSAYLFVGAGACSSSSGSKPGESVSAGNSQSPEATPEAPPVPISSSHKLILINSTGASIRGVYLSPSDSNNWEENILGEKDVLDKGAMDIHFNPEEKAVFWDLRVEGTEKFYAEWKHLNFSEISTINLLLGQKGEKVAVAEVDHVTTTTTAGDRKEP